MYSSSSFLLSSFSPTHPIPANFQCPPPTSGHRKSKVGYTAAEWQTIFRARRVVTKRFSLSRGEMRFSIRIHTYMRESSFRELAYNKTGQTNGRDAAVYIYVHASLRGLSACLRLSREWRMRARDDSSGGFVSRCAAADAARVNAMVFAGGGCKDARGEVNVDWIDNKSIVLNLILATRKNLQENLFKKYRRVYKYSLDRLIRCNNELISSFSCLSDLKRKN